MGIRRKMPETWYRASRVCRVLGNPTAYHIIRLLLKNRNSKLRPTDIAENLKISLTLTSATLRVLRNVDMIRYEAKGKDRLYWIKDETIEGVCTDLEKFVNRMRFRLY